MTVHFLSDASAVHPAVTRTVLATHIIVLACCPRKLGVLPPETMKRPATPPITQIAKAVPIPKRDTAFKETEFI